MLHSEMTISCLLIALCALVLLQRKLVIEDETEFCNEELLHNVLQCKVSPLFREELKFWRSK